MIPHHICEEDSVSKAILHHIRVHKMIRNNLPWSCLTCNQVNIGTNSTCAKGGFEERGSGRTYVLESLFTRMEQEMSLMPEAMSSNPQLWSIHLVMEVLLNPHNRVNEGMLEGAFNAPFVGDCACVVTLGLNHNSTSMHHKAQFHFLAHPSPLKNHLSNKHPGGILCQLPVVRSLCRLPRTTPSWKGMPLNLHLHQALHHNQEHISTCNSLLIHFCTSSTQRASAGTHGPNGHG